MEHTDLSTEAESCESLVSAETKETKRSSSPSLGMNEVQPITVQSLAEVTRPALSRSSSHSRRSIGNRSDSRRQVWGHGGRGDSQRSILSNESLRSSIDSVTEEETMRLVGLAQEEELIQYALECSLSERSGQSQRMNLDESQSGQSPRPVHRQLVASPHVRSSLPSASSFRSALRPASSRSSFSTPVDPTSRSLSDIGVDHHPSEAFRRVASERLGTRSGALEFFDLSPCDEPEFRRVRGVPPSLAALDSNSTHSRDGRPLHSSRSAPPPPPPLRQNPLLGVERSPGATSVSAPAPRVKSTGRSSGGVALSIPQPALLEKTEEVRSAVQAQLTSPDSSERSSDPMPLLESPPPPASQPLQINTVSPSPEEARRAVLAIAKSHLPPMEAECIEQALQLGARQGGANTHDNSRPVWSIPTPPQESLATSSMDWPTPSEHAHQAVMTASSHVAPPQGGITAEELLSIEQALRDSNEPRERNHIVPDGPATFTEEELREIQQALDDAPEGGANHNLDHDITQTSEYAAHFAYDTLEDENEAIARALREADEEEERQSLELAMRIQREEELQYNSGEARPRQPQGNVRTMTRAEYELQGLESVAKNGATSYAADDDEYLAAGYRINSTAPHQWSRRDHNSIVGPNQEVRTKHDTLLNGQANAHRLGLDLDDDIAVGNQAFNSFLQSVQATQKGSMKGSGRTGSDASATKGGGMDLTVRGHISKAINNSLIEKCNGVVKEGKEAVIYHADQGSESGGFDVAIKVFKKIQEFRGRGDYVEGDPRYGKSNFRNLSQREQLKLWADKEYRNLVQALRAGVPVPVPLDCEENIVFMRFLGTDGWPSPQLRELELRKGSSRWDTLYAQVLEAIRRLYHEARLVHADLSEYNILVVPSHFIDPLALTNHETEADDLHVAIIDFGQAVDVNHPSAGSLLERDIDRVLQFFGKQEVQIMTNDEALRLVYG